VTTRVAPEAYVCGPDEGEALWFADSLLSYKVTGDQTHGLMALAEVHAPRGSGSPNHTHRDEEEAWYVLQGALTFWLGDTVRTVSGGDFVFGPRGIAHRFQVDSDEAHFLIITTPAGFEDFTRDCGWPATARTFPPSDLPPHTKDDLDATSERHGIAITPL
jgi:quercetin dioxygenase-like cupin family protein